MAFVVGRIAQVVTQLPVLRQLFTFLHLVRKEGGKAAWSAFLSWLRILNCQIPRLNERQYVQHLFAGDSRPIIIFPPLVNWHIPLYQRPQHVALQLAEMSFLYFFCTDNWQYDDVKGFERISDSLYLTNRFKKLCKTRQRRIVHLYSSDNRTTWDFVDLELNRGNLVLYEFIDEISHKVSGFTIPAHTFEKHNNILRDERCMVIATADKLYQEVLRYRSSNCALVTNGVDFDHFSREFQYDALPGILKELVAVGRPIIGYFGALASWFDYDLLLRVARQRPDYQILLIGWDYDTSLGQYDLQQCSNITVIGPVPYEDLPRYAYWFDVAVIPFKINEITESTSPIKVFEYMALGKPIVTTAMPECRKYRSVLIGEDGDDFIAKLDLALTLRKDEAYLTLLKMEAKENTWEKKAGVIADLIRQNLAGLPKD